MQKRGTEAARASIISSWRLCLRNPRRWVASSVTLRSCYWDCIAPYAVQAELGDALGRFDTNSYHRLSAACSSGSETLIAFAAKSTVTNAVISAIENARPPRTVPLEGVRQDRRRNSSPAVCCGRLGLGSDHSRGTGDRAAFEAVCMDGTQSAKSGYLAHAESTPQSTVHGESPRTCADSDVGAPRRARGLHRSWNHSQYSTGLKGRAIAASHDYDQIPALADRSKQRLKNFFADLTHAFKRVPFVAGEHFSIADITALVTVDFAAKGDQCFVPIAAALGDGRIGIERPTASALARPEPHTGSTALSPYNYERTMTRPTAAGMRKQQHPSPLLNDTGSRRLGPAFLHVFDQK